MPSLRGRLCRGSRSPARRRRRRGHGAPFFWCGGGREAQAFVVRPSRIKDWAADRSELGCYLSWAVVNTQLLPRAKQPYQRWYGCLLAAAAAR
eukprot:362386-Chlamydomonas_euryale.AAC.2